MKTHPLSKTYNRRLFDCGDKEMNRFLQEQALQDQEKGLSRTRVIIDNEGPGSILGFYTLLVKLVDQAEIPGDKPRIKRGIPVVLLGQLGVALNYQKQGYGEFLLMDAQAMVHEISERTGVRAMMLDARTEELARWYESYDFKRHTGKLAMFKNITEIRKLRLHD